MNRCRGNTFRILRACGAVLIGVIAIGLDAGAQGPAIGIETIRGMVDTLEVAQFLAKNMLFAGEMEDAASFGDVVLGLLDTSDDRTGALIPLATTVLEQHAAAAVLGEAAAAGFESIIARVLVYLRLAAAEIRQIVLLARDRGPLEDHREKACAYLFAAMGEAANPFVPDGLVDAIAMLPE